MKCESSSSNFNIRRVYGLSNVVFLSLSIFIISACSDDKGTENLNAISTNSTKNEQSSVQVRFLENVKARHAQAKATQSLAFVEQSKMISNSQDFGVEVLAATRTAAGYMLDFRFRITDIKKAGDFISRGKIAELTIEKNGGKLRVPVTYKLGSLRQSGKSLKENKTYYMLFANPGGVVKAGDLVTFTVGGFKAEHIIVN